MRGFTCSGCGEQFSGLTAFDAHRVGKHQDDHPAYGRHCLGMFQLCGLGWTRKDGVWQQPMTNEARDKLRKIRAALVGR